MAELCGPHTEVVLVNERRWSDVDMWFEQELTKYFDFIEMPIDTASFVCSTAASMVGRKSDAGAECGGSSDSDGDVVLGCDRAKRFWVLRLIMKQRCV